MKKYSFESVMNSLMESGTGYEKARELIATTHSRPTIKRFEGIDPDARWRSEVDEALSDLVGVILSEGYRIADVNNMKRASTRAMVSADILFRAVHDSQIILRISSTEVVMNDSTTRTSVSVSVRKYDNGMSVENHTEVSFRGTTDPIDVYDLFVDGLIPGIERLARFVAGTCEYM